jgi:MoaA/NifB/PqqE/SkfB family radical SAM enzyme
MRGKLGFLASGIKAVRSVKKAYRNDFRTVPRPIALHFEATYVCTCKCVFCDRWSRGPKNLKRELRYDEIIKLIDDSYDLGVRLITLSGGEPLAKKGILKAMQYAKSKGMLTNITTNATLITQANVDEVLASFDMIGVSLDSLDRKKHDEIRGVAGTFDKATKAIRLLKERSKGTVVNIQSVLTSKNLKDIMRINREFSRNGVNTYFQPIHDNLPNAYMVREKRFKKFDCRLERDYASLLKNYAYQNSLVKSIYAPYHQKAMDFIMDSNSTKACFNCLAASLSFFVDPYGEVYPCDSLRVSMGNLRKSSLKGIWYDKRNSELRRRVKYRKCNCWLLCSAPAFMSLSKYIK